MNLANHQRIQSVPEESEAQPDPTLHDALVDPLDAHDLDAVQMAGQGGTGDVKKIAGAGLKGASGSLPHLGKIQAAFGPHDVGSVKASVGPEADAANRALGAQAYASGDKVAFSQGGDSLHTAAHEAAHVIQQRAGLSPPGGVGSPGDPLEDHANAVADLVVQGKSAQPLLDDVAKKI